MVMAKAASHSLAFSNGLRCGVWVCCGCTAHLGRRALLAQRARKLLVLAATRRAEAPGSLGAPIARAGVCVGWGEQG